MSEIASEWIVWSVIGSLILMVAFSIIERWMND